MANVLVTKIGQSQTSLTKIEKSPNSLTLAKKCLAMLSLQILLILDELISGMLDAPTLILIQLPSGGSNVSAVLFYV